MRKAFAVAGLLAAALVSFVTATPAAQAASGSGGNYGVYLYEGKYPAVCNQWGLARSTSVGYAGRTVYLKLYYRAGCGAYARIDNAPQGCRAYTDRYDGPDAGQYFGTFNNPRSYANVWEDVDPGIDYAYTMIADNYNGRVARGALVCNGSVIVRTTWY